MSRIGLAPVPLPQGVSVQPAGSSAQVKGPKGVLTVPVPDGISVELAGEEANVKRRDDSKPQRALHGLTRALLANAVHGVAQGYQRVLEIHGTGYRAELAGQSLKLALGYSHAIEFPLPKGVTAAVEERNTVIVLSSIDKQQLGQVAADIRSLRRPDPYKGKGVRYRGEVVHLKPGKAAGK